GSGIAYSNIGVALAGLVVEQVSGEPFYAYAERHICSPLGMTRSSFVQPTPPALASRFADAVRQRQAPLIAPYPAGSLVTTAADMGKFVAAQLSAAAPTDAPGGPRVLSDSALAVMHAHHWGNPAVPGVALGFFESRLAGER